MRSRRGMSIERSIEEWDDLHETLELRNAVGFVVNAGQHGGFPQEMPSRDKSRLSNDFHTITLYMNTNTT